MKNLQKTAGIVGAVALLATPAMADDMMAEKTMDVKASTASTVLPLNSTTMVSPLMGLSKTPSVSGFFGIDNASIDFDGTEMTNEAILGGVLGNFNVDLDGTRSIYFGLNANTYSATAEMDGVDGETNWDAMQIVPTIGVDINENIRFAASWIYTDMTEELDNGTAKTENTGDFGYTVAAVEYSASDWSLGYSQVFAQDYDLTNEDTDLEQEGKIWAQSTVYGSWMVMDELTLGGDLTFVDATYLGADSQRSELDEIERLNYSVAATYAVAPAVAITGAYKHMGKFYQGEMARDTVGVMGGSTNYGEGARMERIEAGVRHAATPEFNWGATVGYDFGSQDVLGDEDTSAEADYARLRVAGAASYVF